MKSDSPLIILKIAAVSLLLQSCRPAEPPPEKTRGNSENPRSVRDFQFDGGQPRHFVEALDKDFGSTIGKMVNISDRAAYLPLPSFQVRTADPIGAIIALQKFSAGNGGRFGNWQVTTADGSSTSQLESTSSILVTAGDFPSEDFRVKNFQFGGGTPRQFIEALDKDFGFDIGKMVNISPAAESLSLPSFQVRTADPIGAIIALQRFSAGSGGGFGNWQVMTADGSPASRFQSASSILVTPGDFPSGDGHR
ncbi:MAG: hypothetical protein JWM59_2463 [Verrucomicrobiales bacterium]|nr:hypothetical protein [Verrucomicrobiales bacterium]